MNLCIILSSGETSVIVSPPNLFPKLVVLNDREDTDSPPFNGSKVNKEYLENIKPKIKKKGSWWLGWQAGEFLSEQDRTAS